MRCEYRYIEGDEPVVKGLAKVGDQCGSYQANKETKNLCGGHYQRWLKENDPEKLRPILEKRRETCLAKQAIDEDKNASVIEEAKKPDNKYGIDLELLDEMGLGEECDLETEYAHYKMLNLGDGQENYDEKAAYARWLSTPEPKRKPGTIKEAAAILGVSTFTLESWRRSPDIIKFKNRNVESILENMYRMYVYGIGKGMGRGDPRFYKLYKEEVERKVTPKENKFPKLPDNLIQMANNRAEMGARGSLQGPLGDMEKAAVMGMIRDGELEPNEVKQ